MDTVEKLLYLIHNRDNELIQIVKESHRLRNTSNDFIGLESPLATEMALKTLEMICNSIRDGNDIDDTFISQKLSDYFNSPYLAAKLLKLCARQNLNITEEITVESVQDIPHYKIKCTGQYGKYTFMIDYTIGDPVELSFERGRTTSQAIFLYCLMKSPADLKFDQDDFTEIAKLHFKDKDVSYYLENKNSLLNYFISDTNRAIKKALEFNPYKDNEKWYLIKKNEQNMYEISLPKENIIIKKDSR